MKFRAGIQRSQADAVLAAVGATVTRTFGTGVNVLTVGNGRVPAVIERLKQMPQVLYAEPDFLTDDIGAAGVPTKADGRTKSEAAAPAPPDAMPNDPSFSLQWAALNTGQTVNGITGTSGADERLTPAWSVTGGPGGSVVVAVLDTGVQYSHPDLISNIWTNPGGIGGCPAGTHGYNVLTATCDPMDDDTSYGGHGSHVAGIIGGVANNSAGVAGVNWAISILPVKWVTSNGGNTTSNLIAAMEWVVTAKQAGVNVRVANDSPTWAGTAFSQSLSDEIDRLGANDILFVAAAGNTSQNNDSTPRYPCSYDRPTEICVAATDQNDRLASFSNWGVNSVQMAAPGANIYSTLRVSNYGYISGCSMAAAEVSGAAALILSQGYLSVSSLRAAILNNLDSLPSLINLVATGGRLDICKAVPGCTGAVAALPTALAPPQITGIQQYGSILGVSAGSWSGVPARYSYQWSRCDGSGLNCVAIPGATSSNYAALAAADVFATLRATVTAINSYGSIPNQSGASGALAQAASPFSIGSTIQNGQTIGGSVTWTATPSQSVNFVQFYVDGTLSDTDSSSPYTYHQATTGTLDTTTLSNGTHVLGIRALAADNRTYGFLGATVTVSNGVTAPVVSTSSLPSGQQGAPYSATLQATGGTTPYSWAVTSGALPAGISLASATGAITGTPTGSGVSSFTVRVTDANAQTASANLSITIAPLSGGGSGIALVQANSIQGSNATAVSAAFSSANTAGNLIVAFVRMSTATQTVSITDSARNTYVQAVAQAQTTDKHQTYIFYARNIAGGANSVIATFSGSNKHPWLAIYEYSGLSATNPLDKTAHAQGSGSAASSGAATTTTANELIFAGLGLPANYARAVTGGAGFTLQQQDLGSSRAANESQFVAATGSFAGAFTLSANANWTAVLATFSASGTSGSAPVITTTSLPNGQQGVAYNANLAASGGTTPYSWSLTAGALPAGLTLTAATGAISGTPTASGVSSFTVRVTDAAGLTASANLSITISAVSGGGAGIALVQANSVEGSGVTSVSAAFSAANNSGNLIVAFVRMSTATQTVAITDTAGNVYARAVTQAQTTDGHQSYIFYARNIVGGSNTVTATFSSTNNHPWLAVYEFSGLSTTNPLDQTAHQQGLGTVASTGATATTATANELIFVGVGMQASFTGSVAAGAGFTLQQQDVGTSRAADETELAAATGSFTGVLNLSVSAYWTAVLATFQ